MDNPTKWRELTDPGAIDKVTKLKLFLEKGVKGQPRAIDALCKIYQYELTLRWLEERRGPIGVLMFLGPSGVGKTELARMLSQYFMGGVDSLMKIDCSAFSQPHMIHSLIGAPHGYIGYDSQPPLSQQSLLKRLKNKKPEVKKSKEAQLHNAQKESIVRAIRGLMFQMSSIEEDLKTNERFIRYLTAYHHSLHGSKEGEESVAEILQNRQTRELLLSTVSQDARTLLEDDIRNSVEDAGTILELHAESKQAILLYRQSEIELAKLRQELSSINREKILLGDSSVVQEVNQEVEPEARLVILFDEIEKANTTLHQLLLQIMEDGQLTLANGSVTDLRNAFIILTSNVGSISIGDILKKKGIGFAPLKSRDKKDASEDVYQEVEKKILSIAEKEMEKVFRPEFRRRIDEVIVFRPLSKKTSYEILDYHIELFNQSLNTIGINLIIDPKVKDIIVEQSLHRPEVGASLLDHKFKSLVKIPLGQRLSAKEITGTIMVSADTNGKIKFSLGD